jgi:uncharacterized protein YciI
MATFVLTCIDRPDALEVRMAARPAHLEYIAANRARLKLAGPLLDDAGAMAGSLLILEAETRAEVEAFAAADPYALAGLFGRTEIRPMRITIGALA